MMSLTDDLAAIGWTPAELARQVGCAAAVATRWANKPEVTPPLIVAWLADLASVHRARPVPDGWRRRRGVRPAAVNAMVAEAPE